MFRLLRLAAVLWAIIAFRLDCADAYAAYQCGDPIVAGMTRNGATADLAADDARWRRVRDLGIEWET